jgi:hypothetical protein
METLEARLERLGRRHPALDSRGGWRGAAAAAAPRKREDSGIDGRAVTWRGAERWEDLNPEPADKATRKVCFCGGRRTGGGGAVPSDVRVRKAVPSAGGGADSLEPTDAAEETATGVFAEVTGLFCKATFSSSSSNSLL